MVTYGRECIAMQEPPTLPGDLDEIPCPLLAPNPCPGRFKPPPPPLREGGGVFKEEPV